jgi:hypothetical protein
LHKFLEVVFLRVDMESLLVDEEVSFAELAQRVRMDLTFDPAVGSPLNFCSSFRRSFSLGFLCNRYSATWRSGQPDLTNGFKLP